MLRCALHDLLLRDRWTGYSSFILHRRIPSDGDCTKANKPHEIEVKCSGGCDVYKSWIGSSTIHADSPSRSKTREEWRIRHQSLDFRSHRSSAHGRAQSNGDARARPHGVLDHMGDKEHESPV